MIAPLLLALLSAAPSYKPIKLAAPSLSGPNLTSQEAEFYMEHLAQQIAGRGLQITTSKQIQTMLGLERQKLLLGCNESTSCIEELGNALGVDGILSGEIGKFQGAYQLNLKVISPQSGKSIVSYSARVSDEPALLDELTYAARKISGRLAESFERHLPPPNAMVVEAEAAAERPMRGRSWIPAAAGVVAGVAGGVLYVQANQRFDTLTSSTAPIGASDARALRDQGALFQLLGAVGGGVSVVAFGSAAWMFFYGRPSAEESQWTTRLEPVLLPGGAAVAFSGVLP